MSQEIQIQHTTSAQTLYAIVRSSVGTVWQTTSSTLVSYVSANLANYVILLTEQGDASRFYTCSFPAAPAGSYQISIFIKATGSYLETDVNIGNGSYQWSGIAILSLSSFTGLSGFIECDVKSIDGSAAAATIQKTILNACYLGTVTTTGTTTTLIDTGLTQATNDHWVGRVILMTGGALTYRATVITGFNAATDTLTFTLIGGIPQAGDTYAII